MSTDHVELNGVCYEDSDCEEEIDEVDDTLHFFGGLFRRDENERTTFFENLTKATKCWLSKPDDLSAVNLLKAHLPTAVRLSINSPFRDVRENAATLVEELTVGTR